MICVHMHIRDASGDLRSELQNERKLQLMRSELERFVTFFFSDFPLQYFMRFSCFLRLSYCTLRLNSFHDFGLVSFALFCRFSFTAVLFAVSAGSMSLSKSWASTITSRSWTTSWKAQCRFSLILIQSDSCRCTWAKMGVFLNHLYPGCSWVSPELWDFFHREKNRFMGCRSVASGKSKHKHVFVYYQQPDVINDANELVDAKGTADLLRAVCKAGIPTGFRDKTW